MRPLLLFALLPLGVMSACASAQAPSASRVFYELIVTAPGSRSQGVRGTIFDAEGKPLTSVSAVEPVQTPLGPFDQIGCTYLWSVCGHIRRAEGFSPNEPVNDPTISGPTRFQISRSETPDGPRFRGELFGAGSPVGPQVGRIETPMGPFVVFEGRFMGQVWSGWIPQDWLPQGGR